MVIYMWTSTSHIANGVWKIKYRLHNSDGTKNMPFLKLLNYLPFILPVWFCTFYAMDITIQKIVYDPKSKERNIIQIKLNWYSSKLRNKGNTTIVIIFLIHRCIYINTKQHIWNSNKYQAPNIAKICFYAVQWYIIIVIIIIITDIYFTTKLFTMYFSWKISW